jgi:hypothetical protein
MVYEALSHECMRPNATTVQGLELLLYEALPAVEITTVRGALPAVEITAGVLKV